MVKHHVLNVLLVQLNLSLVVLHVQHVHLVNSNLRMVQLHVNHVLLVLHKTYHLNHHVYLVHQEQPQQVQEHQSVPNVLLVQLKMQQVH